MITLWVEVELGFTGLVLEYLPLKLHQVCEIHAAREH